MYAERTCRLEQHLRALVAHHSLAICRCVPEVAPPTYVARFVNFDSLHRDLVREQTDRIGLVNRHRKHATSQESPATANIAPAHASSASS
jgi:hypothetical protein